MVAGGYNTFALTDINNTSGILDAVRVSQQQGLRMVAGIDFRNQAEQKYVGIARNNDGFYALNEHLSDHLHNDLPFNNMAPPINDAFVIYPLSGYKGWQLKPNEFVGVSIKDISTLPFLPYKNIAHKLVILHQVTFANKKQYNAHRLLRAIGNNTLLSKLALNQQASGSEVILTRQQLANYFKDYPQLIANTEGLLNQCYINFTYGKLANKNLKHYTQNATSDMALLRAECYKGLSYRYANASSTVLQRLDKELEVIAQLNFASYYLINWDIVRYAQNKNYYYVGRGSGANSLVAYLLRITDVDPIELDLYFERFINLYRNNAPDFDIDFSWTDREDVTRYIFKRFGFERTALLGSYTTFQHDAVIRELGKVFGLPPGEIDQLQRPDRYPNTDSMGKLVLNYSQLIKGFPSHLSIHASGILISEAPIHSYSATFMPPKGFPTTQFSMLEAEDIGLFKFDILSQRGLGKIKDSLQIIKDNKGPEIDIHQVKSFFNDSKVKQLLRTGKTIGCFYVESPAMRMLLSKLAADDYLRLVAASSIIRPGVAKSGMMQEYIKRFRSKEAREQARNKLPELYDLLHETYGVMVYQEDVIKVAHLFAGLSLAEADYLRRGMSWKFKQRNEFNRVKDNFFTNCLRKGHAYALVNEIWTQIESFANFAFSKGHSASYAVESYQAMFLKAYYPLAYLTATLNNGGGFYKREFYVHEARMHGALVLPPCINKSSELCVLNHETIYLGLSFINGIEQHTIDAILNERNSRGCFTSLENAIVRLKLGIEQLRLLIRVGAFAFTGVSKKELLWQAHALVQPVTAKKNTALLFEPKAKLFAIPELYHSEIEDAYDEMELLGFSLKSPFLLLQDPPKIDTKAADLPALVGNTISILAYLVAVKHTVTSKKERMYFGTFIDSDGYWIDTVHFPPSAKSYPFTGNGCYLITGKVVKEQGFVSIDVASQYLLPRINREQPLGKAV